MLYILCFIFYALYFMLYLLCFICYALSAMLYLLCLICYTLSAMLYLLCFICYALSAMLYLLCFICFASYAFWNFLKYRTYELTYGWTKPFLEMVSQLIIFVLFLYLACTHKRLVSIYNDILQWVILIELLW